MKVVLVVELDVTQFDDLRAVGRAQLPAQVADAINDEIPSDIWLTNAEGDTVRYKVITSMTNAVTA